MQFDRIFHVITICLHISNRPSSFFTPIQILWLANFVTIFRASVWLKASVCSKTLKIIKKRVDWVTFDNSYQYIIKTFFLQIIHIKNKLRGTNLFFEKKLQNYGQAMNKTSHLESQMGVFETKLIIISDFLQNFSNSFGPHNNLYSTDPTLDIFI